MKKALIFMAFLAGFYVNALVFSALPTAQAWTPSRAFFLVHKGLAVRIGTAFGDAMLAVQSDGTKDIISGYNSSGTEVFTVDASGDVAVTQTLTVEYLTGIEYLDFDAQTADPCPGWAAADDRIFRSSGGFYCRCDSSTDDIKGLGDGDTDACTY